MKLAQVTVELRHLLETDFELFDFDYEFVDPEFKKELEQAVIDHYYFHEIGQETPERFKQRFKTRWLRMIGGINELYKTTLLEYDILSNHSISETMDQLQTSDSTQDTTGNSTTHSDSNTKGSDYPQQPIAGGDFLSNETQSQVDSEVNDTTSIVGSTKNENNYTRKTEGMTGSTYPDLIRKHRENIINIKAMVIEELKPCFILVY